MHICFAIESYLLCNWGLWLKHWYAYLCLAVRALMMVNVLLAGFSRFWGPWGARRGGTLAGWVEWAGGNLNSAFAGLAESCAWNRIMSCNGTDRKIAGQMENSSTEKKALGVWCHLQVPGVPFQGRGPAPHWATLTTVQAEESYSYLCSALARLHLDYCVWFLTPWQEKDDNVLEWFPWCD